MQKVGVSFAHQLLSSRSLYKFLAASTAADFHSFVHWKQELFGSRIDVKRPSLHPDSEAQPFAEPDPVFVVSFVARLYFVGGEFVVDSLLALPLACYKHYVKQQQTSLFPVD